MEFTFDTVYDKKALTVMAKALRKTIRRKHSRRSHVFGWLISVLALALALSDLPAFSFRSGVALLVALILVLTLLFEDTLNGFIARKRMLAGTERAKSTFLPDEYHSTTAIGESVFYYENVVAIAESKDYFVFLFSFSHAQLYDKRTMSGGTAEDFRDFIARRCDKPVVSIG